MVEQVYSVFFHLWLRKVGRVCSTSLLGGVRVGGVRVGVKYESPQHVGGPAGWKPRWSWHSRGCVWDGLSSGWAGEEGWTEKRKHARATWT